MNYRTTCPNCVSVFRLGTDQLDAAEGWVQCSVCGAAFDARPSLLMEDGSPLPPPEPIEPSPPVIEIVPEAAAVEAPLDAPIKAAEHEETLDATPPAEPPVAEPPRGIAEREAPPDLPSIILIDPDIAAADDPGPLPQFHTVSTYPPSSGTPAYPPAQAAATPAAAPQPRARIEYASPQPGAVHVPAARRRIKSWVWASSSVLLMLTLLAQTTYFLRDTLVSRLPQTRPGFEQICNVLGCSLSLPKNLAQLQIVGSDLQTEASGRLKLTLTLGNRASHAQAWPMLVLTLTDQRNRPLARRSFAPSEYLGDAQRIAAGIPPRSEQPLSLPLNVRGLSPMGFGLQLGY